jgi:hypothetical protein
MGEKKNAYTVFREIFKDRDHLEDMNEDVKINVKIDIPGIKLVSFYFEKINVCTKMA